MNDLIDIEDRLRLTYRAVAQRTVVDDETDLGDPRDTKVARTLAAVDGERPGAPRRRSRPAIIALAAAVLVVVAGVAVAVVGSPDGNKPTGLNVSTNGNGEALLPEAPIAGRFAHTSVWTGDEMVVFGGEGDDDETTDQGVEGAAAYDPAAGNWREIAEPPIPVSGWSEAVWTGTEIVVVPDFYGSEDQTDVPTGAAYDPATDEWRVIDGPGVCWTDKGCWVIWTGDRVLVAGLSAPTAGGGWSDEDVVATYDPATGAWQELPGPPLTLDQIGGAAWTGDELVYVGPDIPLGTEPYEGQGDGLPATRMTAVALDPVARTWRTLPAPELPLRQDALVAWTGNEVVVAGGRNQTEDGEGVDYSDAAMLDPVTGTWTALPEAPVTPHTGAVVASGRLVVTDTDDPRNRPLVLDPVARTWSFGPADPRPDTHSGTPVAADDQVLVWGGTKRDLPGVEPGVVAEGYAFTVAPAG